MSAEGVAARDRPSRFETGALVAALALGLVLRFAGLGFGLRHTPHWDERVFVESVGQMLAAGDLDHRFYEYPGLFPYLLAPVLAVLPAERRQGPEGYLLARGLVAAFGVLSVFLAGRLGRKIGGPWAGASAALLVAVSPVEVITAHMVRPDVVLESFVLLALLAFTRLSTAAAGDVRAGVAVGAATAVKFSGALLAPAYVVARALAPGPRLPRLLLAGVVAVAFFFLATPYALVHARQFFGGMTVQWTAHYTDAAGSLPASELALYYGRTIVRALGPLGTGLLVLGLAGSLRSPRAWAPLLTQLAVTLLVFSTAERRYERFLVPVVGLLAILAGEGVGRLAAKGRVLAALALGAAIGWPLASSAAYVRNVLQPGTRDLALDWVVAHAAEGARLLNQVEDLGLPRGRFEVVGPTGSDALDRLLARDMDLVLWAGARPAALEGAEELFAAAPRGPASGPGIGVYRPGPEEALATVPLATARLDASSNVGDLPLLADGRLETAWVSVAAQGPGDWVGVELDRPVTLTRVDLLLGPHPLRYGRNLHLLVSEDGSSWDRVRVASGRPAVGDQAAGGEGASQVLWIEPRRVRGVRLVQASRGDRRWAIAELRLFEASVPVTARR